MQKNEITFRAAAYLRLSREDGDKVLSDSITNQRAMIADFIQKRSDMTLVEEYIDDGYTGTNFDRPGFSRLMADIKARKINCIVVKDLSRFGRNYIETGRYLELIFPSYQVRFVSILDHFDNVNSGEASDQILIPFKNLINDAYCRDISMKVRSHFEIKRKSGQFIGSFASYGYRKDPADKNRLLIDEYAADMVRLIFRLKTEGCSSARIAEKLNGMGILPPAEYKRSLGMNYACGYGCGSDPRWSVVSVNRVLTNEMYTGTMVQGTRQKISYRIKQSRPLPKEEWIRVPGTHEPIISREVFELVQELLLRDTRTSPGKDQLYPLSGFIRCADCGQSMIRRRVKKNGKYYSYFHCATAKKGKGCSSHLISEDTLTAVVLESIQLQIALTMEAQRLMEMAKNVSMDNFEVKAVTTQIEALFGEIQRFKDFKARLYADKLEGLIEEEEYREINRSFTERIQTAQARRDALAKRQRELLDNKLCESPWIRDLRIYRNICQLDRKTVVALLERVDVYSKTRVNVVLRHQDEMNQLIALSGITEKGEPNP